MVELPVEGERLEGRSVVLEGVVWLGQQKGEVLESVRYHRMEAYNRARMSRHKKKECRPYHQVAISCASRRPESISTSTFLVFSLAFIRGPLSVRSPMAASASFWVYGPSFKALTLSIVRMRHRYDQYMSNVPSLVGASFEMCKPTILALEPLRTLDTVELA